MSVDRCYRCSNLVDTDNEPEAYVELNNRPPNDATVCLCRNCRDWYEGEFKAND
jgi:hypothetical protein